ncbi:hypothetical protein MCAP1_001785 [Malassezia caprae]|uniref:Uncharacterized protein n=1 Tax=Malassezia caprae TaxID=1381934 RepID=A0AAF0IVD1_9BASI|nr:hypothetical protein MCAP1_001785 [Malassezia caprae]
MSEASAPRPEPVAHARVPTMPKVAVVERLYAQLRRMPESKTLAHLVRFLGTWSGSDKFFMIAQYGSGLVIALLLSWQRLRARRGPSALVASLRAINGLTADARILFRIWAVLPMIQWMVGLERSPPPTRNLQFIERLQALSMVVYSPMEAVAYLAMHKILPVTDAVQDWLWLYGCRLWAAYVVLDFWHIIEDHRVLRTNARALEKSRGHPGPAGSEKGMSDEQRETRRLWAGLRERKNMLLTQFWVNVGYLPLTVHWSVEGGFLTEGWVGFFGTIAAFASTRMHWKATA